MNNNFRNKIMRKNMNKDLKTILLPYVNDYYDNYMIGMICDNDIEFIKHYVYMAIDAEMNEGLSEVLVDAAHYGNIEFIMLIAKICPYFKSLNLFDVLISACTSSSESIEVMVRFLTGVGENL